MYISRRDWKEPSNDGWRIQSVLERSSSKYEKSVDESRFLAVEKHFARLQEQLETLPALHSSISDEGDEPPSRESVETARNLLKELRQEFSSVESVVPAADGGVAIVLCPSGTARAYFQILNDGDSSLVMYDTTGAVTIERLSRAAYLESLKSHFRANQLATTH